MQILNLTRPFLNSLIWGIIGGICMIWLAAISHNGLLEILPYPVFLIISVVTVKVNDEPHKKFLNLFMTGLLTFVIMSLILYMYISFYKDVPNLSLWGHLWRFGVFVGIGIMSSLIVTFLVMLKK